MTETTALLLTLVIELPLVLVVAGASPVPRLRTPDAVRRVRAWGRLRAWRRAPFWRLASAAMAANLLTQPPAAWMYENTMESWARLEVAVVLAELVVYAGMLRVSLARAATISVVANGVTAAVTFIALTVGN